MNIRETLATLARQRPIFHSEADFQHALAWVIHQQIPAASIRLEFPIPFVARLNHVDIWIKQPKSILAIELKYKTRALSVQLSDEQFTLTNQSAQDLGRYDFIKDIYRLEQITVSHPKAIGYAIFLTNDSAYWTRSRDSQPVDVDFRIAQGRLLQGELKWGSNASEGTKRGREKSLRLRNKYAITWEDYAQPSSKNYGKFRYSLLEVR